MSHNISYQTPLRPALSPVIGCKDYREERLLFQRLDELLYKTGLQSEFIELSIQEKGLEVNKISSAKMQSFARHCELVLRGNIARLIKGLSHREFCKILADSHLLRWFVGIEEVDQVKAYAKSTSDRFAHWLTEEQKNAAPPQVK